MTKQKLDSPYDSVRVRTRRESPTITIVVASNRTRALLNACLSFLLPPCQRLSAEVIVARACTAEELMELRAALPGVRFVAASPLATIAQLRGLGMAEASGDIVALTDDHGMANDGWVQAMLRRTHGRGGVMSSGPTA